MDRINTNNTQTIDRKRLFKDGDHTCEPPEDATTLNAEWLNGVQEELCTIIEKAGIKLSSKNNTQLYESIFKIVPRGPRGFKGDKGDSVQGLIGPVGPQGLPGIKGDSGVPPTDFADIKEQVKKFTAFREREEALEKKRIKAEKDRRKKEREEERRRREEDERYRDVTRDWRN